MTPRTERAHQFFLDLQDKISEAIATIDGQRFHTDTWDRPAGGGGRSRVLQDGPVIEKGGVMVSSVMGEMSEAFAQQFPGRGRRFAATGMSLILHPRNPHAPTVHANFRYLEKGEGEDTVAWFGGGADLTPHVLYADDAVHFHQVWKNVCDRSQVVSHPALKKWCDEYFYIPHRKEARGVGGIFFDYLGIDAPDLGGRAVDLELAFAFAKDAGGSFLDAYVPILERRKDAAFTEAERDWQLHRRGRYVEFNLVYDRGTTFGLKTDGRVESILVSLPSPVKWTYGHEPSPNSKEAELVEVLQRPRNWVS
jgi:coproporphyrinogen III oxidase